MIWLLGVGCLIVGFIIGAVCALVCFGNPTAIQEAWDHGYAAGHRKLLKDQSDDPPAPKVQMSSRDLGSIEDYERDVAEAQAAYDQNPSGRNADELYDAKQALLRCKKEAMGQTIRKIRAASKCPVCGGAELSLPSHAFGSIECDSCGAQVEREGSRRA